MAAGSPVGAPGLPGLKFRPFLRQSLLLPHPLLRPSDLPMQLPYLVSNIVEVLDVDPEEEEEEDGEGLVCMRVGQHVQLGAGVLRPSGRPAEQFEPPQAGSGSELGQ